MAYARGSASGWIDFLRKLRDYAAGEASFPLGTSGFTAGTTVDSGDEWEIQTNGDLQPDVPSSGSATDGEVYLVGPGSDVADEIVVGFRTYRNDGNNLYGIETRGYTKFNDLLTFTTMAGASPAAYASYDDASFNFWFWVSNRRIMAIGRLGTNNVLIHAGFLQQAGSRNQYPYPLLISGSQQDQNQNFQAGNFGQSCLPDPAHNAAWLKWIDGVWKEVNNYTSSQTDRSQSTASGAGYRVWPLRDPTTNPNGDAAIIGNEEALFEQFNVNTMLISSAEVGVYGLYAATVMSNEQNIGRIEGMFVVPGLGLVAGDTVSIGGDTYDIFTNTWRTDVVDYFAIKRE